MFDIGRSYKITAGIGEAERYSSYTVLEYDAPLLKVEGAGIQTIFNTTSPSFVSAEKELTDEERTALAADFNEF